MSIAVVGVSHHTAPVEVRERFVFSDAQAEAVLLRLTADAAEEAVLLSTCNRTELYLRLGGLPEDAAMSEARAAEERRLAEAEQLLAERAGMSVELARGHLYRRRDEGCVRHLFEVVTSLDSMILGEAQIQGQVKGAYERSAAMGNRVIGPVLSRLFQSALAVGGRVRSETDLGRGAASVPSAAVELAKKIFGSLKGRQALILGAGEMSELALECMAGEGVESVVVANRTTERARAMARRVGGRAVGYPELPELLRSTDIVIAATAAPHPVLTVEEVQRAFPDGPRHPLLIVDIALPRDVEPEVGKLDNLFLYDIDDLRQMVDENLERRRSEVPEARRIVVDAAADFWHWYGSLEVVPLIRALREQGESMRDDEVAKVLSRLDHLTPEDREAIEIMSRQLLNKLLHLPTVRLREAAGNGRGADIAAAARYLFELDPQAEEKEE